MAFRYQIQSPATVTPVMDPDHIAGIVSVLFFDAGGLPVTPTGTPVIERSAYATGDVWQSVQPFAHGEWRFNGYALRVRVNMAGVTGFTSYTVEVWRDDSPVPMEPDGAYTGLRALTVQPYTEANVKNGLQFYVRAVWPLADPIVSLDSRKLWFKTNAKPVIVKLREFQYIGEEFKLQLFINPVTVTGGTDMTVHNYNGVSPIATTCQAKKNVTTVSDGTEFDGADPEHFFGSATSPQRNVAVALQGRERIIPANKEFVIVITNTGGGSARAQYLLDFYEGGTDLPL